MAKYEGAELLKCSFCGKSQKQVKKLIAGPGVYICDECVDLCNEIIDEELTETEEISFSELPKPHEIFDFLDQYVVGQDQAKKILAEDEAMCRAIGEDTVFAVVRWDETESAYTAHVCGSVFDEGFELTVGEGYGLVNAEGQDISWQPEHY